MQRAPWLRSRPGLSAAEFDRTPPQDIPAEHSVLAACCSAKDAIADVVEVLRERRLLPPAHQIIYDAILDLYGRGEPATPITVAPSSPRRPAGRDRGGAYLHTLIASVPTAANAGYYAQIVPSRRSCAAWWRPARSIVQIGYGPPAGAGGRRRVVDRAQAEVYTSPSGATSEDYIAIDLLQRTPRRHRGERQPRGRPAASPTGFADLDT
jgi:replicative DNA helicase